MALMKPLLLIFCSNDYPRRSLEPEAQEESRAVAAEAHCSGRRLGRCRVQGRASPQRRQEPHRRALFDDSSDETMLKEMADMHARPARGHGDVFDERPELSPAGREVLDRWDAGLQPRREDDGSGGAGPQVVH
uniref:Uncharacterized protein n=2 Tax=Oryza sativa subsp. japonica TaxID=39947 RepID=Q8S7S3_ORYSJ|nr:Hypothetical protein [Oryza sativa Japonica Group]AAP51923.1 hypothetical protein LOC_Os10g03260 [Oryza sativa Japonica Group]